MQNLKFAQINARLFGTDDPKYTQLDWVREQSDHQVFLLDAAQSVRPADLPPAILDSMLREANGQRRRYALTSQLRVEGGADYVTYIRRILGEDPPERQSFPSYDFRLFTHFGEMTRELTARQEETGLARLVAGYAWEWRSKNDKSLYDIELDGVRLKWNTTVVDWVNSPEAVREVGSIHTIQGYDLNYAGVIIGRDLRWDIKHQRLIFDRSQYFDRKGMENNPLLGITYTDEDLLRFVTNIYSVLLTRGIKGTYVYVCDPPLRERLSRFIPSAD